MGRDEPIVSLHKPHYCTTRVQGSRRRMEMVATSLWSPGPLPAHLDHHLQQLAGSGAVHSFRLLLSLTSLGLPQYCDRLLTLSTLLTDRLLCACERSPSPRSRRPLFWCAGLLRLMSDKLESKMCYYNANMPALWGELVRAMAAHCRSSASLQERYLPALLSETSDLVCSFGSFLKDVQAFYEGVEAELASLEAFLARSRRKRIVRSLIILCLLLLTLLVTLLGTTRLGHLWRHALSSKQVTHQRYKK